jgi:protein-S-isoprenylcysteine O-methyltransferase Ste14
MQGWTRDRVLVVLSRWRVEIAWLTLLALPWAHPTRVSIAIGLPVVALGVALRVWARGHLQRSQEGAQEVTTGGPYAYVRHPLYVGSFLIGVGFATTTALVVLPVAVAVAFVAMYVPKALREEAYLRRLYGTAYAEYAQHVGAVIPSWTVAIAPSPSRFAWRRVMRHREWRTWLGVAAALAVLCGLSWRSARPTVASADARTAEIDVAAHP